MVTRKSVIGYEKLFKNFHDELKFISRIEKECEAEHDEFFTVKEILSPKKVRLSNGLTVKLIGIRSEPFTHDKAVRYLTEKIKGKRIFLKYDKLKHDT